MGAGKTVGDESRRIAAPLIDKSNLVKGVPFAGENAMQLAPKSAKSDDELLFGNAGINVLEYVRSKNGISGMMLFDSTSEEDSANRLSRSCAERGVGACRSIGPDKHILS